jgi:peptide/nickel transport system permease protein
LRLPGTLRLVAAKLLVTALTIVGAVTGVFLLLQFVPGDLATVVLGTRATPELRAAFAEQMGLDQPVWMQLWMFLTGMLQGDFGTDVISGRSILDLILEVLPFTLALAFSSLTLGLVVGISLGVLAASRPGSLVDRGLGFVSIAFDHRPCSRVDRLCRPHHARLAARGAERASYPHHARIWSQRAADHLALCNATGADPAGGDPRDRSG